MRQRLREVAELAPCDWIVLLREEPHVVSDREHALEEDARLFVAALQDQVVGEPERAREEDALTRGSPSGVSSV